MTPVKSMPCRETMAPGTAAPVKGLIVEEAVGVLEPVAPATPGTALVMVAKVVTAATGGAGTEVTPTRPTVGVAPTPVAVAVVNAT
jgi:hypothetical protein